MEETIFTKPVLKWAGGKSQLLGEILPRMPKNFNKYIEPFFGSGAVYFAIAPHRAVIADSNPELINLYKAIATDVEKIIAILSSYENTKERFYTVRAIDWKEMDQLEAAARTIYLNKTCFNGLYRVNRKGLYNVPPGKYKNPKICNAEKLLCKWQVA